MIVITAKLVRDQSAVFLCGETVECFISFANPSLNEHRVSQSNSDIAENLAWAAVQIHCYCNSTVAFTEKAIEPRSPQPDSLPSLNDTSIAAAMKGQGQVVMKTEPRILFCDLRLTPGETKSCKYDFN